MKPRTSSLIGFIACGLLACSGAAQNLPKLKPYSTVIPAPGFDFADAETTAITGSGLQVWTTTLKATKNGKSYPVTMVGHSPFSSTTTTNIPVAIVPVIININGTVFNPTVADTKCMVAPNNVPLTVFRQSPLFGNATYTMGGVNVGTTQYTDAYQRANFWKVISPTYHTRLSTITVKTAQTYKSPTGSGAVYSTSTFGNGGCGPKKNPLGQFGIIDINAFDAWVNGTALLKAAATSNELVILLIYNVVMSNGAPVTANCCILGYHGATAGPPNGQTYSPMEFDQTGIFGTTVSDTSIAAHEIGEWMDDPYGRNAVPAWGGIGQVSACQSNLENGDPLSGSLAPSVKMSNNYIYHLQELAYFGWFFNAKTTPSISAGGKFSNAGKFTGPAKVCPPGGTF